MVGEAPGREKRQRVVWAGLPVPRLPCYSCPVLAFPPTGNVSDHFTLGAHLPPASHPDSTSDAAGFPFSRRPSPPLWPRVQPGLRQLLTGVRTLVSVPPPPSRLCSFTRAWPPPPLPV